MNLLRISKKSSYGNLFCNVPVICLEWDDALTDSYKELYSFQVTLREKKNNEFYQMLSRNVPTTCNCTYVFRKQRILFFFILIFKEKQKTVYYLPKP